MRIDKGENSLLTNLRRLAAGKRQLAVFTLAAILAACSSEPELRKPQDAKYVEGFLGGVAADEPQAALIGREVLAANGNAVDAAVATFFAMSVTLPSAAGLGGGGVCLVFDRDKREVQAIEFLARPPADHAPETIRPTAVPGAIRGFYMLHGRYGRLRWSELLAPAERLAGFGAPVSRALANDLQSVQQALLNEPSLLPIFASADGTGLVAEGDRIVQIDLAAMLARVRNKGPAAFYSGQQAAAFVDAVASAGGSLDREDLETYQANWQETVQVPVASAIAHFVPPPPAGGMLAAQMSAMLGLNDRYEDADTAERAHLLVETAARAFAERRRWQTPIGVSIEPPDALVAPAHIKSLMADYQPSARNRSGVAPASAASPENPSAATLVTVDREGSAVACAVTLNSLWGIGRIAPGTGIVLAALPGAGGRGAAMLSPMLVVNQRKSQFYYASTASGGVAAPTALVDVAARVLLGDETLNDAILATRLHGGSDPDRVFGEAQLDDGIIDALGRRGHRVVLTPELGHVSAIACTDGLPDEPDACVAASDPRAFGLAIMAD